VQHGDITQLSIYANQLKQNGPNVIHGQIREVSLVLASANPEAFIESVLSHSDDGGVTVVDDEGIIYTGDCLSLYHSDENLEEIEEDIEEEIEEETIEEETSLEHADDKGSDDETVAEVFDTLTEKQKTAVYYIIGQALENDDEKSEENKESDKDKEPQGGNETMKHNVFENDQTNLTTALSHSDQEAIIKLAKTTGVGSLQEAIRQYVQNNQSLSHSIDDIESLFPEYKDVKPGAPELVTRDYTWVDQVMRKVHKSPITRIRTRHADATAAEITAKGYSKKGKEKTYIGNIKLAKRTTDPQTVYVKDKLDRDDIIDITDFDVPSYILNIMRDALNEKLALSFLIGDGLDDGDEYKVKEEHIRSIWHDDELYTIHHDVDLAAVKAELQGSDTSKHFGDNYIYAEALIQHALYAREKYKGSGNLEMYCEPHLLNVMLLARDLNGRRIYSSKADLAAALNVSAIHTVEQMTGKTRVDKDGKTKKLLALFVNLSDYQVGCAKGGQITNFDQFDIDFNQYKYLMETRLSGALVKLKSAIALEEPVNASDVAEDLEV
jgi:hypothetical protein